MTCLVYAKRPTICRDFSCGKPCVGCGACCANVVVCMDGFCGSREFLEMHGVSVMQKPENFALIVPAPCRHYRPTKEGSK